MCDVAALYAPRGLLMMDNAHIDHLSYKANYLGCAAAMEVYKYMNSGGYRRWIKQKRVDNRCNRKTAVFR